MEIESTYLDLGLQQHQIAPRVPFIFSRISVSPFLSAGLATGTPSSSLCGPGTKILLGIIKLFTFYIEHFLFFPQQHKSSLRGVRVLALKYILVIPLYIKFSFLETAPDMVFTVLSAGLLKFCPAFPTRYSSGAAYLRVIGYLLVALFLSVLHLESIIGIHKLLCDHSFICNPQVLLWHIFIIIQLIKF